MERCPRCDVERKDVSAHIERLHPEALFMRPDGLMIGYVEVADDFGAALEGMSGEEINTKWQEMMAPYFENPPGTQPDENMVVLEEVFHLD